MKRTQWHVTCTHNVHKKSGTSASFKKFNVSPRCFLADATLDDFICKRERGGTVGWGRNEEKENAEKKRKKKKKKRKKGRKEKTLKIGEN